jgi:hypothetical protein
MKVQITQMIHSDKPGAVRLFNSLPHSINNKNDGKKGDFSLPFVQVNKKYKTPRLHLVVGV